LATYNKCSKPASVFIPILVNASEQSVPEPSRSKPWLRLSRAACDL